jgi:hypothetical protein
MAKQSKTLPGRKQHDRSRDEESLLLRSAESLGRVIGSLQRQLDVATKHLTESVKDGAAGVRRSRAGKSSGSRAKSGMASRTGSRKTAASKKTSRTTARKKTTTRS